MTNDSMQFKEYNEKSWMLNNLVSFVPFRSENTLQITKH